ncbi:hypothetical protein D3C87_1790650 [compost metagenome]
MVDFIQMRPNFLRKEIAARVSDHALLFIKFFRDKNLAGQGFLDQEFTSFDGGLIYCCNGHI